MESNLFKPSFIKSSNSTPEHQYAGRIQTMASALEATPTRFTPEMSGMESFTNGIGDQYQRGSLLSKLSDVDAREFEDLTPAAKLMVGGALKVSNKQRDDAFNAAQVVGAEAFERNNSAFESVQAKAAGIMINKGTASQLAAIEALYPTVVIDDTKDLYKFGVPVIGLTTNNGSSNYRSVINEVTPICSLLRDSDFMIDSPLKVVPVYNDEDAKQKKLFVSTDIVPLRTVTYSDTDRLRRPEHETTYLKVGEVIVNYLGLCVVPGTPQFEVTDQIEPTSVRVEKLLIEVKFADGSSKYARIELGNVTNTRFAGMDTNTDGNDSHLNLPLRSISFDQLFDPTTDTQSGQEKDRTPSDALEALTSLGYKGTLNGKVNATFNKNGNRLEVLGGKLEFGPITKDGEIFDPQDTHNTELADILDTIDSIQFVGYMISANLTNSNRLQFGYRLEMAVVERALSTNRRTPVHMNYPLRKEDQWGPAFDEVVEQMTVIIRQAISADGYRAAKGYIEELITNNGLPITKNTQNGADVPPSRFFLNVTGIRRTLKIKEAVGTLDSKSAMDNLSAVLVNELCELKAALETHSNLAALDEQASIPKRDWNVIVHQNFSRYIFRKGDARTDGGTSDGIIPIETNYDDHVGRIWLVPKSTTTQDNLDLFGGLGICLVKENIVTTGSVTRDNRDFGVIISLPTYSHCNIACTVGELFIEDAEEALSDVGLIRDINKLQVGGFTGTTNDSTEKDDDNSSENGGSEGRAYVKDFKFEDTSVDKATASLDATPVDATASETEIKTSTFNNKYNKNK